MSEVGGTEQNVSTPKPTAGSTGGAPTKQFLRQSPGCLKSCLFLFVLVALIPALLLGVAELAVRILHPPVPTTFLLPYTDASRGGDAYITNPKFAWQFFPKSMARAPLDQIIPKQKPAGGLRVVLLGSSAAMGDPDPNYGMGRVLQAQLEAAYPGRTIEVINAAMTGINSHVVRVIAQEIAPKLRPDVVIIYEGNNEAIGPYGPAAVFGGFSAIRSMTIFSMAMRRTALGQWLAEGNSAVTGDAQEWRGLAMFEKAQMRPDAIQRGVMPRLCAENISDAIAAGYENGARVVLADVAVNLRDWSPFASYDNWNVQGDRGAAWRTKLAQAQKLLADGKFNEAHNTILRDVLPPNKDSALVAYLLAQAFDGDGMVELARPAYENACERDTLVFRRPPSFRNEVTMGLATRHQPDGLVVADIPAELQLVTTGTLPGDDVFLDHVHFNFRGNVAVGNALFASVRRALGEAVTSAPLTESQVAARLALTPADAARSYAIMRERFRGAPYTGMMGNAERLARTETEMLRLGQLASARGGLDTLTSYSEVIARHPKDPMLRASFANILSLMGRHGEAAAQWQACAELMPHSADRRARMGIALVRAGQLDAGETALRAALAQDPEMLLGRLGLGLLAETRGNNEEALRQYRVAAEANPNSPDPAFNLAGLLVRMGRHGDALPLWQRVVRARPADGLSRLELGLTQLALGKRAEAQETLSEAAKLDASNPEPLHQLGVLALADMQTTVAEDAFRRALQAAPAHGPSLTKLGAMLADRGDFAQALGLLQRGATQDAQGGAAYVSLALVHGNLGQFDAAARAMEAALKIGGPRADWLFQFGRVREGQGKFADAIGLYRQALKLQPDYHDVQSALAWLLSTTPDAALRNGREAVDLATAAVATTKRSDAVALDTLAAALAESARFDEAAKVAKEAADVATAQGNAALAADATKRVQEYTAKKPHREGIQTGETAADDGLTTRSEEG